MTTTWLELSVTVDAEAVEPVAELFAKHGYGGGVVVEPPWVAGDEGPEFYYDAARPVTLRTYLVLDEQGTAARQQIEAALWHLGRLRPVGTLATRTLAEEDWANSWKQHYRVLRVGERTVIVPSWLEHSARPDDIVIQIDPGMAFGSGLHPTTQLCLALLERYVCPGQHMLDLGTGSGILAIAGALLGATPVLALDNDPLAVQVAGENIANNGLGERAHAALGSLGVGSRMGHWLSGDFGTQDATQSPPVAANAAQSHDPVQTTFDLIAANLIAKVLIMLAPDIAAVLATDGIVISSGIIIDREDEVALALAAAGLDLVERRREGEWVALVHSRPPSRSEKE